MKIGDKKGKGRQEWQTTSVFLPWEPHEQYRKARDVTLKDKLPRSVGAQYTTGEEQENSSRRNEEAEPKRKHTQLRMWLVMEVKSDAIKNNIA